MTPRSMRSRAARGCVVLLGVLGLVVAGGRSSPAAEFVRGDANADARVDIADPIYALNHLFLGGPTPPCADAADANDDGGIDITDGIFTLNHLFLGGDPPPPPYPEPGADPTDDGLGCLGDTDGDGLPDEVEMSSHGSDPGLRDTDGDGIDDGVEVETLGTSPVLADTDGDGLLDPEEDLDRDGTLAPGETDPLLADTDGDGLLDGEEFVAGEDGAVTDPRRSDTDGDGLSDGEEWLLGTAPDRPDSDEDGLSDGEEVAPGVDGRVTPPLVADGDDDGLLDGEEATAGSDPARADTDGDGLSDGEEHRDLGTHPTLRDSDGDGLDDRTEVRELGTDPRSRDSDDDGIDDRWESERGLDPRDGEDAGADPDDDGLTSREELAAGTDPLRADCDSDGATDGDEVALGTDPLDPDSDDDGALDGAEVRASTDPLDPDSDDDGILDGIERAWSEDPDGDGAACAADTDSDGDGLEDPVEDADRDGRVDEGETDPTRADSDGDTLPDGWETTNGYDPLDAADGARDDDGDGLSTAEEHGLGSDPTSADTDGDTLPDGLEASLGLDPVRAADAALDLDADGLSNAAERARGSDIADPDSDDDGLLDGDEVDDVGSDPLDADSDDDGLDDGEEVDEWRSDPLDTDSDDDGVEDGTEVLTHGSDPVRIDSDGDSLPDGEEVTAGADGYVTDPVQTDSDGDGLGDREELAVLGTDPSRADTDGDGLDDGEEVEGVTDPLDADSDDDGVDDGEEVDRGMDPLDTDSDDDGVDDGVDPDPVDEDIDDDGLLDGEEALLGATWLEAEAHGFAARPDEAASGGQIAVHAPGRAGVVDALVTVEPGTYRLLTRARSGPRIALSPVSGVIAPSAVSALAYSAAGVGLLLGEGGEVIRVEGDVAVDLTASLPPGPHGWRSCAWAPDGSSALLVTDEGEIWSASEAGVLTIVAAGLPGPTDVAWRPDGTSALVPCESGTVYRYVEGSPPEPVAGPPLPALTAAAWSADGSAAIIVGAEATVVRHDALAGTLDPVATPATVTPDICLRAADWSTEPGRGWIVVGDGGTILRGAEGTAPLDLTPREPGEPPGGASLRAVAWAGEEALAVGEDGSLLLVEGSTLAVLDLSALAPGAPELRTVATRGETIVVAGDDAAVVEVLPPRSVSMSVEQAGAPILASDVHLLTGRSGKLYRWYSTPPFTAASGELRLLVEDPAWSDPRNAARVDRCLLVRSEVPGRPLTCWFDPDSDGDGLLDGGESAPYALWIEAEDFAPAARRRDDDRSSNARHVLPETGGAVASITLPGASLPAKGWYQVFVRATAGPAPHHVDASVGVHVALGPDDLVGTAAIPDTIDATVRDSAGRARNDWVWRPGSSFELEESDEDLVLTFTAQGADASTVRLDKVVVVRQRFVPVAADGAAGMALFCAPRHMTDPMDPDTDLDQWRFVPPPYPPGGALPGSEGALTDAHEVAFGMNPFDPDTDQDLAPDAIDLNPLSADSDGDGLLDGMEDRNLNVAFDPPAPPGDYTHFGVNDSDGDGILDGNEDANLNGRYDADQGETSSETRDLDGDGLPDGHDTDGDGLPDGLEIGLSQPQRPRLGLDAAYEALLPAFRADLDPASRTDPRRADSDGDGLDDGDEDANRNGAYEPDLGETDASRADSDGDGLDDGEEMSTWSTDPRDPDSDGDGQLDGVEVNVLGTDPRDPDSDGDGLSDGEEVTTGDDGYVTDPNDEDTDDDGLDDSEEAGVSDPRVADTDGDGLDDGAERKTHGSDPRLPDSDGDGLDDFEEVHPGRDGYVTRPDREDTDADGFGDGEEGVHGTDPTRVDPPPTAFRRAGVRYEATSWSNSSGVLSTSGVVALAGPRGCRVELEGDVTVDLTSDDLTGRGEARVALREGVEVEIFDGEIALRRPGERVLVGAVVPRIGLPGSVGIESASDVEVDLASGSITGTGTVVIEDLTGGSTKVRGEFEIRPRSGRIHMEGDVTLDPLVGPDIPLAEGHLTVDYENLHVSGHARLPLPDVPGLEEEITLPSVDYILDLSTGHVRFFLDAAIGLAIGPVSVGVGSGGRFEIDPRRGYFLIEGGLGLNTESSGTVEVSVLLEIDASGSILLEPRHLLPGHIDEDITGHLRAGGEIGVPLAPSPLTLSVAGELFLRAHETDPVLALDGTVGIGIYVVGLELGGSTAVILFDGGHLDRIVMGSEAGIALKDFADGIGDFGRIGLKGERVVVYDFATGALSGTGVYSWQGFELDVGFVADAASIRATGLLDPPFGTGTAIGVGGLIDRTGAIDFTARSTVSVLDLELAGAELHLQNSGMEVSGRLGIPDLGEAEVEGWIEHPRPGAIDYELHGVADLRPGGAEIAGAEVTVTPDGVEVSGSLDLPGDVGSATVRGRVSASGYDLSGDAELDVGGFTASGKVRVTPARTAFEGDLDIPGGGAIRVGGEIDPDGDLLLRGSGTTGTAGGFSASGTFELVKDGGRISLDVVGSLTLASGQVGSADLSISGRGEVSGTGSVRFGGQTFSVTVRVDPGGDVELEGEVSLSGRVKDPVFGKTLVSASGSGRVRANDRGEIEGRFEGRLSGPAGPSVDVETSLSGSLTISVRFAGKRYSIKLD